MIFIVILECALHFDAYLSWGLVVLQDVIFSAVFLFYNGLEVFHEELVALLEIVLFFGETLLEAVLEILYEIRKIWFRF